MPGIPELVEPSSTVVICHELQRGVVGDLAKPGMPPAVAVAEAKVLPVLAGLLDTGRQAGVRVVHVAAVFRRPELGSFHNSPILQARPAGDTFLLEGTPEVEPVPELVGDGDIVLHRFHGMSPFAGTELDWILKSTGAKTVVVTGVSLNRGVFGTTIEAVNYGYQVVLPRDGVAGYPKEYGEMVLEHSLAALAWLTDAAELTAAWSARGRR
ncbi:MAG TPA: isochorismatase family cysteine hydrolase [Acidimicrobiales bacterium]|jgi:nicotinamidase-related amidase|nr:isochorismatase family cysteine hydrolase [Acidimicrobiales bacterium]